MLGGSEAAPPSLLVSLSTSLAHPRGCTGGHVAPRPARLRPKSGFHHRDVDAQRLGSGFDSQKVASSPTSGAHGCSQGSGLRTETEALRVIRRSEPGRAPGSAATTHLGVERVGPQDPGEAREPSGRHAGLGRKLPRGEEHGLEWSQGPAWWRGRGGPGAGSLLREVSGATGPGTDRSPSCRKVLRLNENSPNLPAGGAQRLRVDL